MTPKIGRNEPCPCKSGKKYKHCHYLIESVPKMAPVKKEGDYMGVYIDFSLLYGKEANSRNALIEDLESFDLENSLQIFSRINYALTDKYGLGHEEDFIIAKDFLEESVLQKAIQLYKAKSIHKIFTFHQILALMIENLLLVENKSSVTASENKTKFGKVLFRITSFLENDVIDNSIPEPNASHEEVLGTLLRNMFVNDAPILTNLLGRYYAIFF
jgi:hypothetical protein